MRSAIEALRSFARKFKDQPGYVLRPSKNPLLWRWHRVEYEGAEGRDPTGRFQRGNESVELNAPQTSLNVEDLQKEWKEIQSGERHFYLDRANGHHVTSGKGYQPLSLSPVRDLNGVHIEPLMYEMLHPPSISNGFTVSIGQNSSLPEAGLWYSYYARGMRDENGLPNAEHLHDLHDKVLRRYAKYLDDLRLYRTLGHVYNEGWPIEDHMERVHLPTQYRFEPGYEGGIERSYQATLVAIPREGEEGVLPDLAHDILEHAESTGYKWMYPDIRIIGSPKKIEGFSTFPALNIPGKGGFYTILSTEVPESARSIFPGSRIVQTQLPSNWEEILQPMRPERLEQIRDLYQIRDRWMNAGPDIKGDLRRLLGGGGKTSSYSAKINEGMWLDELVKQSDRILKAKMSPEEIIALSEYDLARSAGLPKKRALELAARKFKNVKEAMAKGWDPREEWPVIADWFDKNGLDNLTWDEAVRLLSERHNWDVNYGEEDVRQTQIKSPEEAKEVYQQIIQSLSKRGGKK